MKNMMNSNILAIMKKECARLFGDKRLLFTAVIMPGLLMYLMYTLMGNFLINRLVNPDAGYIYQVYVVNMPDSFSAMMSPDEMPVHVIETSEDDIDLVKQRILDKETDLLIKFPIGFDQLVADYDIQTSESPAPNVQIWSNMARKESMAADTLIKGTLNGYEHSLSKKFDVNAVSDENPGERYDMATEADLFGSYVVFILPLMMILFIFSGCQAIAPESIVGEKERGTLGTLLATPVKRRDLALAKILSVTVFGLFSAAVSFVGFMSGFPKLMGDVPLGNFYSAADFAMIFVVSLSTVLVFVSLLSILSTYAKSIKEATSYTMPFMILSMICGLSGVITGGALKEFYYYFIPVFNSAQCLTAILKFEASAVNIAVTVCVNVAFMLVSAFILAKMFNSEKIVFDK